MPQMRTKYCFINIFWTVLSFFSYKNWCMIGNWNGVASLQLDRNSEKNVKVNQGKLPNIFFDLMHNLDLFDQLMQKSSNSREYIYFSEKIYFPRTDIFWISKNSSTKFSKAEISPKNFSDHNPVTLL